MRLALDNCDTVNFNNNTTGFEYTVICHYLCKLTDYKIYSFKKIDLIRHFLSLLGNFEFEGTFLVVSRKVKGSLLTGKGCFVVM